MIGKSPVFSGFLGISICSFSNINVSLSIIRSWVDVEQVETPSPCLLIFGFVLFLGQLGRVYGLDTIHDLKLEKVKRKLWHHQVLNLMLAVDTGSWLRRCFSSAIINVLLHYKHTQAD